MKLKVIVFVLIFFSVKYSSGQEYSFKVLVLKGKSEIKSGGSWQTLKTGASLKKNDQIRVPESGYLGLVSYEGKPVEVKEPGVYSVATLLERVKSGSTVMSKYTDFILSSNDQPKNSLKATGAVTRGTHSIQVFIPSIASASVVYGTNITINWDKSDLQGPFQLTFTNPFGDELKKIETKENQVAINLEDRDFQNEDNILLKVLSKNDNKVSQDQLMIKRLSKADKERIRKQMDEIKHLVSEETALNHYYLGGFFESQGLLIDAATSYLKAISLAPDVQEYKDLYEGFLLRAGLKTPQEKK